MMRIRRILSPRPEGRGYRPCKPSEKGSTLRRPLLGSSNEDVAHRLSGGRAASLLLSFIIGLTGCENQPTEVQDYRVQPVLAAYLVNGEPVTEVFLQWVAPLYGYYELNSLGISGCDMIIFPLDDPQSQDTLHLVQHPDLDSTWVYVPAPGEAALIPQSRIHYRIEVHKASEAIDICSETVVPDSFELLVNGLPSATFPTDTMTREDPNIQLNWTVPDSVGGYVILTRALTALDSIVPLDPDFEIGVDTVNHAEASLVAYWMCRYDQTTQPIPWMLFSWVGPTTVEFQAAAPGYNDYVTSLQRASMGFPIQYDTNVQGGMGIFGGLSRKKFEVVMERVE